MNRTLISEIAGWLGVGAIVAAYLMVSFKLVDSDDAVYQILNLVGALLIAWISYRKRLLQTVVLNVFWAAIALVALVVLITG